MRYPAPKCEAFPENNLDKNTIISRGIK